MRIISYGGGVQSTALIVLATQGRIGKIDAAVFANVGEKAEHPDAIAYVRDVMRPWAAERGLPVVEVAHQRDGETIDLYDRVTAEAAKGGATSIPLRMPTSGKPGNRTCTADHKARAIGRYLKAQGATKKDPATVLIGISTDEFHRATNGRDASYERREFPLLDLGLSRAACQQIIQDAGLPSPGKSACWFCPFTTLARWRDIRRDEPHLFERAADLEAQVNEGRAEHGRHPVWLCSRLIPLREAIDASQDTLPFSDLGDDGCDTGACWT